MTSCSNFSFHCWICTKALVNGSAAGFPKTCESCLENLTNSKSCLKNGDLKNNFANILEAAVNSINSFEICTRLLHSKSTTEIGELISSLIINFAKSFKTFQLLSHSQQLAVTVNSSQALVLSLVMSSHLGNFVPFLTDTDSLVKVFPLFKTKNHDKLSHLKAIFDQWQPSIEETVCLMAMILGKGVLKQMENGYTSFIYEIFSIISNTLESNRSLIFDQIIDMVWETQHI